MTLTPQGGFRIGCPQKGTLRLLSPIQLTNHGVVSLSVERFCPELMYGRRDSKLLKDIVRNVVELDSEVVERVLIDFFHLDVYIMRPCAKGELGKVAKTLYEICRQYQRPVSFVGSSEREFVFH